MSMVYIFREFVRSPYFFLSSKSQQNVTSVDLAPKCVASLFPKGVDVRITKAFEATCWLKAFFAKTNSYGAIRKQQK